MAETQKSEAFFDEIFKLGGQQGWDDRKEGREVKPRCWRQYKEYAIIWQDGYADGWNRGARQDIEHCHQCNEERIYGTTNFSEYFMCEGSTHHSWRNGKAPGPSTW